MTTSNPELSNIMNRGFWQKSDINAEGIFKLLDKGLYDISSRCSTCFPYLHSSSSALLTSDYSGEHDTAGYHVLSFLVTSLEDVLAWEPKRSLFRSTFLPDGRRMSFKKLTDQQRWTALPQYLTTINALNGLSFTIAISSSIVSLFEGPQPLNLSHPSFATFRSWPKKSIEKAFRIVHFLCFLVNGLLRPGQNVLWVTDEDPIAANSARLTQLTQLVSWIASLRLDFNLGHLRCGTTASDDGSRSLEDLASVPDLVAGAIAEHFTLDKSKPFAPLSDIFFFQRPDFSEKTLLITQWLASSGHPLRKIYARIDSGETPNSVKLTWRSLDEWESD